MPSLVGSEMCIRDSSSTVRGTINTGWFAARRRYRPSAHSVVLCWVFPFPRISSASASNPGFSDFRLPPEQLVITSSSTQWSRDNVNNLVYGQRVPLLQRYVLYLLVQFSCNCFVFLVIAVCCIIILVTCIVPCRAVCLRVSVPYLSIVYSRPTML